MADIYHTNPTKSGLDFQRICSPYLFTFLTKLYYKTLSRISRCEAASLLVKSKSYDKNTNSVGVFVRRYEKYLGLTTV